MTPISSPAKPETLSPASTKFHQLLEQLPPECADREVFIRSEVLNAKRGLSKTMIARLAERFAVEPGLFLECH